MPIPPNRQKDGEPGLPKRSLMDKLRRRHPRGNPSSSMSRTPSTGDLSDAFSNPRPGTSASPAAQSVSSQPSDDFNPSNEHADSGSKKKESKGSAVSRLRPVRFPFVHGKDGKDSKDGNKNRANSLSNRTYDLDSDFTDISDIVQQRAVSPTDKSHPQSYPAAGRAARGRSGNDLPKVDWSAPESWVVTKHNPEEEALDQENSPVVDEDIPESPTDIEGKPYCLRIFRPDGTFTTLSSGLHMTVSDTMQFLARKSILQDMRDTYEIVLWRHNRSKRLNIKERPIFIQKQLLELAGYQPSDRISDIGREDNSYLCRFTFLPTRYGGFSSRGSEPDFTNSKFRDIVLPGRSLITIPIALFTHSNEIVTLDISCNPTVKVPKDFIQRCHSLREIKFVGNEIKILPASFSYAEHLTYLDISNNRIASLEPPRLGRLRKLVSLKLANNNLDRIPDYFSELTALRSVNISSNDFTEIPTALSGIRELDISFNNLTTIKGIGHMKRLRRLWITNNRLSGKFSDEITQLRELRDIDARHNLLNNIDILTELPNLMELQLGHNVISQFIGAFRSLRKLIIDYCPVTVFDINRPMPSLVSLSLAAGKLVFLKDSIFGNLPNLTYLNLNKNRFVNLSPQVGALRSLESLSMVENRLSGLPPTIGCLTELRYLNLRECNLVTLPPEIWYCSKLDTLNLASNVLESFPSVAGIPPVLPDTATSSAVRQSPTPEESNKVNDLDTRRPSNISSANTNGATLGGHNSSVPSLDGRKPSASSFITSNTDKNTEKRGFNVRKDSTFSQVLTQTFALSLHFLSLADNQLENDVYHQLSLLQELRVLNLSYNALSEFPYGLLKRWYSFSELYISGNELSSLPADDFEETSLLRVLHINENKFQVLPSELCRLNRLTVLDVGSNSLKYNVSNWRYDWNWNWNANIKYLNFSGNKRFEIKPHITNTTTGDTVEQADLTNFSALHDLRVLGLMDVTITDPAFPDETNDRRIRTSASISETISYGMADTLGRTNHLSMIDVIHPRFQGNSTETVLALFDGTALPNRGSSVATYLQQNMKFVLIHELKRLREGEEISDALRRTFLALNKDMGNMAYKAAHDKDAVKLHSSQAHPPAVSSHDNHAGATAALLFLQGLTLYAANVGNVEIILVQSSGYRKVTDKHVPTDPDERARIRRAGGYVARSGKLNDEIPVSRAFGYFPHMPAVIAAPTVRKFDLTDEDEMIIMATSELWDYINPDVVSDVARGTKRDPMLAAQKLRDLAIAYGATNKLMVMVAGVYDLRQRERVKDRSDSQSLTTGLNPERIYPTVKRGKRTGETPTDSRLARLERVEAPTGEVAIIFTDIKGSTQLWENCPAAMQSAIQIHNELFRRQLVFMGGYEIKTEGDAFMVAFGTPTAALLWCFACQRLLLREEWPEEITNSETGRERYDDEGHLIFRGLSVRMGMHWGRPVCERDPVTGRMDYFGPMVNRAARICTLAGGGEIYVSSDYLAELRRVLLSDADFERNNSTTSDEVSFEEMSSESRSSSSAIRRELGLLGLQGWEIKDRGEHRLKGLETPEFVYLIYPHSLSGRVPLHPDSKEEDITLVPGEEGAILGVNELCSIWRIATRLEQICSAMESSESLTLDDPTLVDIARSIVPKQDNDKKLAFFEHMVTRVEGCVNTLFIRNLVYPFPNQMQNKPGAISMNTIWHEVANQMDQLRNLKQLVRQLIPQSREDSESLMDEEESPRSNVSEHMSEGEGEYEIGDYNHDDNDDNYDHDGSNDDPYESNDSGKRANTITTTTNALE